MRHLLELASAARAFPSESRVAGATEAEVAFAALFDTLIFVAYFTIPYQLYVYLKDVPAIKAVLKIRLHFILFIVLCGVSHLVAALSDMGLLRSSSVLVLSKGVTAVISMKTAHLLSQHAAEVLWLFTRTAELEKYVDQLKKTNVKLNDLRHQAQESAQTSKNILSSVSHEVRTPIHAIKGSLEVIQQGTTPEEQKSLIQDAHDAASSLLEIINKILTFTQVSRQRLSFNWKPMSMSDIVDQVMDFSTMLLPKDSMRSVLPLVELSNFLPHEIITDGYHVVLALKMLVENALSYTTSGHVLLRLSAAPQHIIKRNRPGAASNRRGKNESSTPEDGRPKPNLMLIAHVIDTGIGIPEGDKPLVFDQLSRLSEVDNSHKHSGIGLGLAICDKVMNSLGGEVLVYDNDILGKGTVFEAQIPIHGAARQDTSAIKQRKASVALLDTIIVSDDIILQRSLDSILRHCGVSKISFCNRTDSVLSHNMGGTLAFLGPDVLYDSTWCTRLAEWEESTPQRQCVLVSGYNSDGADATHKRNPLYNKPGRITMELPVKPGTLSKVLQAVTPTAAQSNSPTGKTRSFFGSVLSQGDGPGLNVLIVDDSHVNLKVEENMVKRSAKNCIVTTASDGLEALERWDAARGDGTQDRVFDFIIMDLNMPKLDGQGATREIRKLPGGEKPFIVALTGDFVTESRSEHLYKEGFDMVLMKPLAMKTLKDVISSIQLRILTSDGVRESAS